MSSNNSFTDKKYTHDYFMQENVCRLCWNATNSIKAIQNDSITAKKILAYIGIDVATGTPNKVCYICLNKIKSFIDFKKCCQTAEEKLTGILSKEYEKNYNAKKLKKEADFELKLLAEEVKKEKLDRLIIKQEKDSNFEIDNSISDYNDLLPKDDNFCYVCSLKFNSTTELKKHILKYHKTKESVTFQCNGCKEEFTSFSRKTTHELHLCKAMNEIFNCDICNKKFETYQLFESHMRVHEILEQRVYKQHKCPKCPKIFQELTTFTRHLRRTHERKVDQKSKTEKIVCDVCGRIYSKATIHIHMLIHTNFKQLKCPHCDYRATLRSSLKTHIKHHTGERPFACEQCPYRCITSSNLTRHRKSHTGEKKYTCQICQKSYRHNATLREHISIVHEGERKYKCKQCTAQYYRFKGLRKHVLVKHGCRVRQVKNDFVELDEEGCARMGCEDNRQ